MVSVHYRVVIDQTTLRRASINILLSMLPLPLHFLNTTIEGITSHHCIIFCQSNYWSMVQTVLIQLSLVLISDISSTITRGRKVGEENRSLSAKKKKQVTFYSLKRRILSLLLRSFEHETDPTNMQLLMCGLLMVMQDHVTYENTCAQTEAAPKDTADAEVSMITQQSSSAGISPVTSLSKMINISTESYFPSTFKSQENLLLFSSKDAVG